MLDYSIFTDKGERSVNEDSVGFAQNDFSKVFILADGLGGHGKGDEASSLVVKFIENYVTDNSTKDNEAFIDNAVMGAQNALLDYQKRENATGQLKTTLTLLCINNDNTATLTHVGDSRIYKFVKNKYVFRTLDHSVPQILASSGEIRDKDIRRHEDRNRLLRCMGIEWETKRYDIDKLCEPFQSGDVFLLCSDGLWDWIWEKDMQKALKKFKTAQQSSDYLVEKAKKRGAGNNMDNFSLIIVRV